tara:strand:- start:1858 stop:3642 length:1785 start_codon:yes stop_codon:yes gene_type:complete
MLVIHNLTVKNFMSVGNVTQSVVFDDSGLTLVLGNNLDLGGDGSRNGTGKTTIINALSYALFGSALTSIKKDNLINKTNSKNMLVTVDFSVNNDTYRIERGRKPNIFKFLVNSTEVNEEDTDESQGESRKTQEYINKVINLNHNLFKHIVSLNTYTEPFLSLRPNDQREIIELLLGITQLSEKAEVLKNQIKITKDSLKEEEIKIKTIQQSNENIQKSIDDIKRREKLWNTKQEKNKKELITEYKLLNEVDIEKEIKNHNLLDQYNNNKKDLQQLKTQTKQDKQKQKKYTDKIKKYLTEIESLKNNVCYACEQSLLDTPKHREIIVNKQIVLETEENCLREIMENIDLSDKKIKLLESESKKQPQVFYDNLQLAWNHKTTVEQLEKKLIELEAEKNPYTEQVESLTNTAIQEIDWAEINRLNDLLTHQDFLLKLLIKPDSFIRRKIIDQNLKYLNGRLAFYLDEIGLPHQVKFLNNLDVEITELGRDLDFDNLSRGERNRLILSLSWAFRDVYESLNIPINFVCIDELIDSGMDSVGVDSAMAVLKRMSRQLNKNIFLISHRDELQTRSESILHVTKENGFTQYNTTKEFVTHA